MSGANLDQNKNTALGIIYNSQNLLLLQLDLLLLQFRITNIFIEIILNLALEEFTPLPKHKLPHSCLYFPTCNLMSYMYIIISSTINTLVHISTSTHKLTILNNKKTSIHVDPIKSTPWKQVCFLHPKNPQSTFE